MKVAVLGAGAIGSLVAGYLHLNNVQVELVGKSEQVIALRKNGISINGVRGNFRIRPVVLQRLNQKVDLAILATKTQDIDLIIKENLSLLSKSKVVTTQNGIQAERLLSEMIPPENIISSIVMFGATYLGPGEIVHNFEGSWIIGRYFPQTSWDDILSVQQTLKDSFSVNIFPNILNKKYTKIFINAHNCIPAILGVSMQEAFVDLEICKISIMIWKEAYQITQAAKVELESLPGFSVENITRLIQMPLEEAARIFSGIMLNLSKEPLYGSILQSIKRARPSEIDYINGEFVQMANSVGLMAPLNKKLVEMVHSVEKSQRFFSKDELLAQTRNFLK